MKLRTELIALAIRALSTKTELIRKPDNFEMFLNSLLGVETYDVRLARTIEAEAARAINATKRARTTREFKKIVHHI